jgi:hypothetical protein
MEIREILDYLFSPEGVVIFAIIILLVISIFKPQYTLINAVIMFLIVARYIRYREENNA